MSVVPYDEIDRMTEMVTAQYEGVVVDQQVHHEAVSRVYGELIEGSPADEQMANAGRVIAVLFWKLAQARGLIKEV